MKHFESHFSNTIQTNKLIWTVVLKVEYKSQIQLNYYRSDVKLVLELFIVVLLSNAWLMQFVFNAATYIVVILSGNAPSNSINPCGSDSNPVACKGWLPFARTAVQSDLQAVQVSGCNLHF